MSSWCTILAFCAVIWASEVSLLLLPLLPMAGMRGGTKVIRAGQLALPLTHCSTQETRAYTSPGLHNMLCLDVGVAGSLAPKA